MTSFREMPTEAQQRLEDAAAWRLRLQDDPSLELSSEFLAWIAEPGNCSALKAVGESWSVVEDLGASPELLDLRRAALGQARKANTARWMPRKMIYRAAAALLVIGLLGGGALYVYLLQPTTYETDVGERRIVALADGSRISMDSDTELSVHYSKTARTIELDRGRARFDVAHDVTRPFTVSAGTETVVAVGTSFNVEKIGSKVLVTLIQGHVVIKNSATPPPHVKPRPPVSLDAGEELVASRDVSPQVKPANMQAATAWEAGQLIFKDVSLDEAVARENRYTDKPVIVDPSVASIRVSGVFNAGDVASFVSAVTSYFPVQATTTSDNEILLQRRS